MPIMRRMLQLMGTHYKDGVKISLALLVSTIITVVTPFIYKELIDHGIMAKKMPFLFEMLAVIVLFSLLQELLLLYETHVNLTIRKSFFSKMRIDLYQHLLKLPQNFYSEHHKGRMLSRITSDVDAVQNMLLDRLVYFFQDLLVGCFIFVILFFIDWKMIVAAAIFLPLLYLLYLLFKQKLFELSKALQEEREFNGAAARGFADGQSHSIIFNFSCKKRSNTPFDTRYREY